MLGVFASAHLKPLSLRSPLHPLIAHFQFNQYIRKYLAMYPDTADADIPRFEDFDLNHDGMVTFDEWQMYLDRHREVRSSSVSVMCVLFSEFFFWDFCAGLGFFT